MNVQLAHMFFLATQQATLPPEQRKMMPELICKKYGVEMGKFEVKPYLEEIKDEITISYPEDILAIITERKATARTAAIAGSLSTDALAELGSVTLEPTLQPASLSSDQAETSSAIGK